MTEQREARRIRAFVADDERLKLPRNCEIEIYRPPGSGESQEGSASGWLPHVQDIYRNKYIEFDLLSIDVFFTEDGSDPIQRLPRMRGEPPASENLSSGLIHGLAAMARRRAHDQHGNVMPLAWEVRTVSPSKQGLTTDQWAEVTRTYGLLLALMTPYVPGQGFLGLGSQPKPALAVLNAFQAQPSREGAAMDLPSLLEDWRVRFVASVRAREVNIDVTNLRVLQSLEPTAVLAREDAFVAIVGRRGQICDRILLRSIFSDLAIAPAPDYRKVTKWILQLIELVDDLVGYAEDTARWVEYLGTRGKRVSAGAIRPDEAPDYWLGLSDVRKSLALVTYGVAAIAAPVRFPPFRGQKELGGAIGVENFGENTIIRMFEKARTHVQVKNARELRKDFLERLADPGLTPPFSPLFMRALGRALIRLDLEDAVRARCPVLRDLLESTA